MPLGLRCNGDPAANVSGPVSPRRLPRVESGCATLIQRGSGAVTAGLLLSSHTRGDSVELSAAGSWTAEYAGAIEPQVDAATRGVTARSVAINIARVDYLDTYGAWLIERTLRNWTSQGRDARLVGLREDYRGLFDKVHSGTQTLSPPPPRRNSIMATLESVGMTSASVGGDRVLLARMLGSLLVAFKRVMLRPTSFRF